MTIEQALLTASNYRQAGQLSQALELCRLVVAQAPGHVDALHLLGLVLGDLGQHADAVAATRRAIELNPQKPELYGSLGCLLQKQGQAEEAVQVARRGAELNPRDPGAHYNLAVMAQVAGKLPLAIAAYEEALALRPDWVDALINCAVACHADGKTERAITLLRQAIQFAPDRADAHYDLGIMLQVLRRPAESAAAYEKALELRPGWIDAMVNLGVAYHVQRRSEQAVALLRQVIELNNDRVDAHYNLGMALHESGHLAEALPYYRRALELEPEHVHAIYYYPLALQHDNRPDEAVDWCRRMLQRRPRNPVLLQGLGSALLAQGVTEEGLKFKREAIAIDPQRRPFALLEFNYAADADPAEIFAEHRMWDQEQAQPLAGLIRPHVNDRNPERRLRIGYVSPDFHEHSVRYFMEPVLAHHDHEQFHVICYYNSPKSDHVTERLRGLADEWREIVDLDDGPAADQIRADGIDILVDLAGHTSGGRMLVFARKPAPVQVNYCGYTGSTGLSTMDYLITDPYLDPPGQTEQYFCEQLVRLPETFVCYGPPECAPPVGPLPADGAGRITFCSFNTAAKMNSRVLEVWSRVLTAVPDSRLLLKVRSFNSEGTRRHLREEFGRHGVSFDQRVMLEGFEPIEVHLEAYNRVDIALDPFPFNGHTTSMHAMWMGVPVVALAGSTYISRRGVSILSNLGLPQLIARTQDEYVDIACALARDLPGLRQLRSGLRQRLRNSPLTDAPRYVRHLEDAYRAMWRRR